MRRKENQPRPQDKTDEGKMKVGHYCPWKVPLSQMFENDTGREVWNCGFHLYTGQNRRCRRKSTEARLSTLGCRAAAMNPPGSRTSRLVLAHWLSACQHSCYMKGVRSSSILSSGRGFLGSWCMFVQCNMRDCHDFDSWMRRSVARKKWDRSRSGRRRVIRTWKESTRNWRGTSCIWATFSTKARLILTRKGELQIIFMNFENFIKRLDANFFFVKRILLRVGAGPHWGQDGRCSARFRSHLQHELRRSQSKLQGRRYCAAQNIKGKALRAREQWSQVKANRVSAHRLCKSQTWRWI